MSGDQQECVKDAPPVWFGEVVAHCVRECRQGGHELGGELVCIQVERGGDVGHGQARGLISSLGSWLLVLAVPAHILAATGSLRDTGLALAAQYLPQLVLGPVAGVVADSWDRRRLMIGANLFCAGAVAVMLVGTAPERYWVLYAALIAENAGTVLYAPALQARTPAIVGTGPMLSSANSLTSASSGIVRLAGGPLGGVLLAVCGIRWLICAGPASRHGPLPDGERVAERRAHSLSESSVLAAASTPGSCCPAWARASCPAPSSSGRSWTGRSPGTR